MKNYLLYLIKTKWLQTLIIACIPTLIFIISIMMNIRRFYGISEVSYYNYFRAPSIFITALVFIMIIIPIIVIFRMGLFRNSKDVDLYYSLPISRKNLLLTQLLFGFIQLVFIWSMIYLLGLLVFTILSNGYFYTGMLLLGYLIVIFYIAVLYGITSFLFLRGNTIVDGIAFIIIFHTACLFISWFFTHNLFRAFSLPDAFAYNPFYSVGIILRHFINYSLPNQQFNYGGIVPRNVVSVLLNSIGFSFLSVLGYYLNFKLIENEKTEQIGRLSTSRFGYVSLIPINLFFGIASIYFVYSSITWLAITVLAAAGFIGFFIMRRSVKIKWIDAISVATPIILGIIMMTIIQSYL
jgi:ABC-type transport system involved in multi-copper enzyme maturation permease subunit